MKAGNTLRWTLLVVLAGATVAPGVAAAAETANHVRFDRLEPRPTAVRFDGRPGAPPATRSAWLQAAYDVRRAAERPAAFPDPSAVRAGAVAASREGVVPLGLLDVRHGDGGERVFAATALSERTLRGARVTFRLDRSGFVTNVPGPPRDLAFDPGDGRGFRPLAFGASVEARYAEPGEKTARLRAKSDDGTILEASFPFEVAGLVAPDPDDTLHVTATEPWMGVYGTGLAYVYRAPGHATLQQPVVVVEGFDLDNTLDWDPLYELLNRENLLEDLRASGFDLVVLDFTDATVPIQENARVLETLLATVSAEAPPGTPVPLVGASMGGLVGRYALAHLEFTGQGHPVSTFISFDAPHLGADIPLGIQYWLDFFSGQSADAAYLLGRLDRPAARQMLVYHHTDPPGAAGQPDPARAAWLADLAALGDWPSQARLVAVANGSGTGMGQGFAAGAQIIDYSGFGYRGNVWAVPDGGSATIFDGWLILILSPESVTISGTEPYDNAPGGTRATMAEMDASVPPIGDIVALHDSHCFIPTVSALAYDTADLFHDVSADPDPLAHTPFDAIYFPAANQEHVAVTPENAAWLRSEIEAAVTAVGPDVAVARPALGRSAPNPFVSGTRIAFALAAAGDARVVVYDVEGRRVRDVTAGFRAAGWHEAFWDGRDAAGRTVPPGLYFVHLRAPGGEAMARLVRVR